MKFLIFILILSISAWSWAQGTTEEELRLKGQKDLSFNLLLGYSAMTDRADTESESVYFNALGTGIYAGYMGWTANVDTSFNYTSVDGEVKADQNDRDFYLQDTTLSISKALWQDSQNTLSPSVFYVLPTNQATQNLGIKGVLGLDLMLNSRFFKNKLSLTNSGSAYGIINTYYYSPLTGLVNQNAGYSYKLGLTYQMFKGLSASVGGGVKLSQYVDGSQTFRFQNSARLSYQYAKWTVYGFWMNGSYSDQTDLDLWYVDEYRQIVGVGFNVVL
ncbi:MAG TPA: hypothetical protein DCL41_04090 [Bdellovibrionales bacterium]|nr:hypothetical protein [Pseudobdellovibrionaceae bacterium]HAG91024.1 hypothetical protein [Bdellovibrionales bacterium]|tara:strand:+ start:2249 stop:3070 length:822 start_codon:yes stop_codon:yes gene_type:complete